MTRTLLETQSFKYKPEGHGYLGPTKYFGLDIAPWNHPKALVNEMLGNVIEWQIVGMQLNAPMGKGKSQFATAIAHNIHTVDPRFTVRWAGAAEFMRMEKFLESLPKYVPVVIIFDDITSALKQMDDKELHMNFNALTRVRHIIDPEKSETPVIIFTTGHYSKNVEKEFRNVMEYNGFVAWTNEEHTNMDGIAPKNTQARYELKKFIRLYTKIASAPAGMKKFALRLGNKKKIEYEYSHPFRPCCVIFGTEAKIILYSKDDQCQKCAKGKVRRFAPAKEIYDRIIKAHGASGLKALRLSLWRSGYFNTLPKRTAIASRFIEERLFSEVTTDLNELHKLCFTENHKAAPKTLYRSRKRENELMNEIFDVSEEIEIEENE